MVYEATFASLVIFFFTPLVISDFDLPLPLTPRTNAKAGQFEHQGGHCKPSLMKTQHIPFLLVLAE